MLACSLASSRAEHLGFEGAADRAAVIAELGLDDAHAVWLRAGGGGEAEPCALQRPVQVHGQVGVDEGEAVEVVIPSLTMQTEFPVALVEKVVDKKGTRKQAQAYLEYLWSKEGQENAAQNYLRPRDAELLKKYAHFFPPVKTFTVDEVFGGANKAFAAHFKDGGSFDQIYLSK